MNGYTDHHHLAEIEWEGLAQPQTIEFVPPFGPGHHCIHSVELARNRAYELSGTFLGEFETTEEAREFPGSIAGDLTAGTIGGQFKLDASTGGSVCWIDGCSFRRWTFEREPGRPIVVRGQLRVNRYFLRVSDDAAPAWVTDWFLNGPHDHIWRRATSWTTTTTFVRERDNSPARQLQREGMGPISIDHVSVSCPALSFTVHRVPEEFGPPWSKNVGIEYQAINGSVPDEETRTSVSEIVSFLFGRRLVEVGTTVFAQDGSPIEHVAINPWGSSVENVCQSCDTAPVRIERAGGVYSDVENLLATLVPRYLERRNELGLGNALWQYWMAKEAYLGVELPIYSSAIELLANAWFKSRRSSIKGLYMKQEAFTNLLQEELESIKTKLADKRFGDRMIRRMLGAHNMGTNERVPMFFDELNLSCGPREQQAIAARNSAAHGGRAATPSEIDDLMRCGIAYQTLFHRVVLRLLDYEGSYVDRCTLGHPSRPLDEPAGGSSA